MKNAWKKLLILGLVACLILAGCGPQNPEPLPSDEPSLEPSAEPSDPVETFEGMDINLAVLSGPTGVGAAKLLSDSDADQSVNHYHYTICTDNEQVVAGLTSGEFDIAAIATNVAANLYNKSNGTIQIAAINTLGVLYILGPSDKPIEYLGELRGKTLYATGQGANPQYALDYLLTENGLDPSKDVNIVWGTPDEVNVAMLQGKADYCMLPVPAATALEAKSEGKVKSYISLSDEWDYLRNGSQLTMGCVVVRADFAEENPQAVEAFLSEYEQSIAYVQDNPDQAAALVAGYGIAPSEAIAAKAIPQCNLTFIAGSEMRATIQGYYEILFAADPASIGGGNPDDGFYFIAG